VRVSAGGFRLGVDFGTSNTVAVMAAPDGTIRPLVFDGSELLPSAVCVQPDGMLLVGRSAVHAARSYPDGFEPNPKRVVDEGTVLLGGRELGVVELFAAVLARVAAEAGHATGGAPPETILTCPAVWGTARRRVLLDAAARAGFGPVRLVPEPVAAAWHLTATGRVVIPPGAAVLVYDLGAGTFDATLLRRTGDGFEIAAAEGLSDTGGLDVDAAVVGYLGAVYSGRDAALWHRLAAPATPDDRRAARLLWDDVRVAKELLSRASSTLVHVPLFGDDMPLGRPQLEALAAPVLERTVRTARAVAGSTSPAAVFLVGGASRIPLAGTLAHRAFRVAPTAVERPELVAAEGALHTPPDRAPAHPVSPAGFTPLIPPLPPPVPLLARPEPWPTAPEAPAATAPPADTGYAARPAASDPTPSGAPVVATARVTPPPQARSAPPGFDAPAAPPAAAMAPERAGADPAGAATRPGTLGVSPRRPPTGSPPDATPWRPSTDTPPDGSQRRPQADTPPDAAQRRPQVGASRDASPRRPWTEASPDASPPAVVGGRGSGGRAEGIASAPERPSAWRTRFLPLGAATLALVITAAVLLTVLWPDPEPNPGDVAWRQFNESPVGDGVVTSMAMFRDGRVLAGGFGQSAQEWTFAPGPASYELRGHTAQVSAVAIAPDESMLATGQTDGTVRLFDGSREMLKELSGHRDRISGLAFSPNGSRLASGGRDGVVRIWNTDTQALDSVLTTTAGSVNGVAWSPDGRIVAAAYGDAQVQLYDIASKAVPFVLRGHTGGVTSVAFGPDGKTLATGSQDNTVRIWTLDGTRATSRVLPAHAATVIGVAFSRDGKTLASASADRRARVWNVPKTRYHEVGGGDAITAMALAPDAKHLATAAEDHRIHVWTPET
jgi:hypothetical protein